MWLTVGIALRFTNLTGKPPWTDEFATFVYSLGHSFQNVPLDKAISMSSLLQPLQPSLDAGIGDVVNNLLAEDVHPPLYFAIAHLWMQMFPPEGGYISVWGARSLPALIGAISIPVTYWLSKAAFRSQLVGHLAAAMMAVSPYDIFLSQEARHYSLATLWVLASLGCLMLAARCIQTKKPLPVWLGLTWVAINTLGISTHYFVVLTLLAEGLVLMIFSHWSLLARYRLSREKYETEQKVKTQELEIGNSEQSLAHSSDSLTTQLLALTAKNRWRLMAVAVGTLAGALIWLPQWQHTYGAPHTEWLQSGSRSFLEWLNPLFQSFAAWVTMLYLLPVEAPSLPIVVISGLVMAVFFLWAIPILRRGLKILGQQPATHLPTLVIGGFILAAIAEFFAISYGLGLDITRGARYYFVYFPAAIVLLGAILAAVWNEPERGNLKDEPKNNLSFLRIRSRRAVALIWLMGLASGLTVACNLGYQKYYRPDLVVPVIQKAAHKPVLIATTHKTLVQVGEMMGLAWEFKRVGSQLNPQFLLAHQDKNPETSTATLQQTLTQLPRPLDLWVVNFHAPIEANDCAADLKSSANGYEYQLYHCH